MSLPLSPYSILAVMAILAGVAVAWSKRFLAVGSLALASVAVFVLSLASGNLSRPTGALSVVQSELAFDSTLLPAQPVLAAVQVVTSMFVHRDLWHLAGNLIILFAFALPFEERVGARAFTVMYLGSGLAATFIQLAVAAATGEPMMLMGASGAIAGVIGAFAASYPNLVVPLPLPLFVIMLFVRMRVWVAAGMFALTNLALALINNPDDHTAYGAHLGGLAFGLMLGFFLARAGALGRRKPVSIDLERLSPFAQDNGSRNALTHMSSYQKEPQVFQAWLERFLRTATCPTCKHRVMPRHEGEMVCTQGHRFDVRSQKKTDAAPKAS